jgi:hypothetical protein
MFVKHTVNILLNILGSFRVQLKHVLLVDHMAFASLEIDD